MGYRTIEEMYTKDGIYVDRVNRFNDMYGVNGAKARMWFFLYNCTADENLSWAVCTIQGDEGAVYANERYEQATEEPVEETTEE